jgi:uncharacterized protein
LNPAPARIERRGTALHAGWLAVAFCAVGAAATTPSFDCSKVRGGSIAELVCRDDSLAQLDNSLARVYAQALKRATNEHPPTLKAEQRGWIKGRDECWKSPDPRACAQTEYQRRIAELQARYRLLAPTASLRYACDGDAHNEVIATYFPTDPPTLIAERGDAVSTMFLERSGSGAKYAGRNETLWEHQGSALIRWGPGAPQMHCTPN